MKQSYEEMRLSWKQAEADRRELASYRWREWFEGELDKHCRHDWLSAYEQFQHEALFVYAFGLGFMAALKPMAKERK